MFVGAFRFLPGHGISIDEQNSMTRLIIVSMLLKVEQGDPCLAHGTAAVTTPCSGQAMRWTLAPILTATGPKPMLRQNASPQA